MEVGLYGLGRFGSFWAETLARSFDVKAFSRSSRIESDKVENVTEDEVLSCKTIFYCVSISSFDDVLKRTASKISSGSTVFDTCSVKISPIESMRKYLGSNINIIGSHPMFGPDSAKKGLEGLPIVLTKVKSDEIVYEYWMSSFKNMGFNVIEMTAEDHDKTAAYTQGVTHLIGRLLKELDLKPSDIGTLGYKKILNVVEQTCNDPYQLFLDLQKYNPYTKNMREDLYGSFQKIMKQL